MKIEKIDGLFCVFDRSGRILVAYQTREDAEAFIRRENK